MFLDKIHLIHSLKEIARNHSKAINIKLKGHLSTAKFYL